MNNLELLALASREAAAAFQSFSVTSPNDERLAAEALVKVRRIKNELEEQRIFLVKPLNDHVRSINAEVKKIVAPLVGVEETIAKAITAYHLSPEYIALKERERAIQDEAKKAVAEGDMGTLAKLASEDAAIKESAPNVLRTETGSVGMRDVVRFKIEDENLLPREYLVPDEKKIRAAAAKGVPIPGVTVWLEKSVSIYGA